MSDAQITIRWSAGSERVINAYRGLAATTPDELRHVVRAALAYQMRETRMSFENQAQPGGSGWIRNQGRYAEFKRDVVGQTKAGILHGDGVQSMTGELYDGGYTSEVGSALEKMERFGEGTGGAGAFSVNWRGKDYFFVLENPPPARPFLPTDSFAMNHLYKLCMAMLEMKETRFANA